MTEKTVDVETINILLIGNKDEIAEGLRLIDSHFREKIVGIIRKKALSANADDLFDIYQDVILSILEYAATRKYDPDARTLEGLLYTIAYRRAADWVRMKIGIKEKCSTDELLNSTREIICGSKYDEPWQKAQSEMKRGVILKAIENLIPTLKHRQRQIAELMLVNFPNFLDDTSIKTQLLDIYGEDITTVAVKSARQEVCSKIKDALSIAGYGEYADE